MRTTVLEPSGQKFPDLVERDFTAIAPNQKYVGDIKYLPLVGGQNLYLATEIDCASRKLAGYAVADHMRVERVEDALKDAANNRGSLSDAVFHNDRGSVSTSKPFTQLCVRLKVKQSMGAVGSSADNALAESFNAALKREILGDTKVFVDAEWCRLEAFRWVTRYNTVRRHSFCGNLAPNVYEDKLYTLAA